MYSPLASMARTSASFLAKSCRSAGLGVALVCIVVMWCAVFNRAPSVLWSGQYTG